jgi:hypothetical protein
VTLHKGSKKTIEERRTSSKSSLGNMDGYMNRTEKFQVYEKV